ncbi:RpiB/LacA/LacB family sugar-phosphate isomerase [Dyadobacter psychrotolerans]|uniref:Ribose 5-phosphate isomerase B n=1 Tax=Dyadobacter psychrotolerans TaxID=2541721 RepID=A0A4R5DM87_9BACT|nr:RpiB/LacA/LacB family sugar-phosphate isomerase [Dyadobacter psychrotolerans]TDE15382.1 ribose 5-phosphate isomerase B [Dyadobacter psychrotolerans]
MKIGIAADHGGYELKENLKTFLSSIGYQVQDFGAFQMDSKDDYPDFVIPLGKAIVAGEVDRGIAVCGSGVGASVAANKLTGVRAALINDHFSAHQGVEDDNLNMLCLGGRVTGTMAAQELAIAFLKAEFTAEERHLRRLAKVAKLEGEK